MTEERGRALLVERAELIARTDAFDRRWWRVAKCCRYAEGSLTVAALTLLAGQVFFEWPWWLAWSLLVTGQAFGWGHRWSAAAAIKRRLAATLELCAINDRMRVEAADIFASLGLDPP